MSNRYSLILCIILFTYEAFPVFMRIEQGNVEKIKNNLIGLAHTTHSSGNPRPVLSSLKKNNGVLSAKSTILIAKINAFGLDIYGSFETQMDIDMLIKNVMKGGGLDVSWYYLLDAYKYELEKIRSLL